MKKKMMKKMMKKDVAQIQVYSKMCMSEFGARNQNWRSWGLGFLKKTADPSTRMHSPG
jgi:hypothetical protein